MIKQSKIKMLPVILVAVFCLTAMPIVTKATSVSEIKSTISSYLSQAVQSIAKLKVSKYLNLTGYLKNSKGDVKVDDNLKVTGNITTSDGKTVDGVDVSSLSGFTGKSCTSGQMLKWDGDSWECSADTDTKTSYTAGSNVAITDGVVSATDNNTTYTAGSNVAITDGVVSATDNNTTYTAGSGLTLNGTEFSIGAGAITNAMLSGSGCATSDVLKWDGDSWECTVDADSGTIGSTVESSEITDGTIMNGDINGSAAIALAKLATGTSGQIIVANGSGIPTYVAMSSDATISNAGVLTVAANAIGSSEITDSSIANTDISTSAAIALSKLATGTSGQIIVANGSGVPAYVSLSGDATITDTGVLTLAIGSVGANEIGAGAIASNGGLELSSGIKVKVPAAFAGGLQVDASGVAVYLDSDSGLQTTTGLKIDLDGSTLALTSSGLKVGTLTDAEVPDNITISGGTINNTPIGGSTPSTVAATTLTTSGLANVNSLQINSEAKKLKLLEQLPKTVTAAEVDTAPTVSNIAMTIASDGYPSIVYFSDAGGTDTLYYVHCGNATCSSGNGAPVAIDTVSDTSTSRDVDILLTGGSSNYPIIFYTGFAGSTYTIYAAYCADNTCATTTDRTIATSSDPIGMDLTASLTTTGRPIVAYTKDPAATNQTLESATCSAIGCATGVTNKTLDSGVGTKDVGDYVDSIISAAGYPLFAYYDRDTAHKDLMVAACVNATCAPASSVDNYDVNTTDLTGIQLSFALGSDGYPVIASWYNSAAAGADNAIVTKCTTINCSTAAAHVGLDTSETDNGKYTQIIIADDGYPTVFWYDASGTNLYIRGKHCFSHDCSASSPSTLVTVLDGGANDVGKYLAAAKGADGRPFLAYYDATDVNLETIQMANDYLMPYWARR